MKPTLYISFKTFLVKVSLFFLEDSLLNFCFFLKNNITRKHQLRTSTILNDKKLDEIDTNNSTQTNGSMLLRRHSGGTAKSKRILKRLNNSKLFTSFPNYNQIPRTTRKSIFRFLCDNGWIDI
jgi:hypothetical protein